MTHKLLWLLQRFVLAVALVVTFAFCREASADTARTVPTTPFDYTLPGDQRWVVLSSRQDGEMAIAIGRHYAAEFRDKVQVVLARNGRYAVIVGPEPVHAPAEFKRRFMEKHDAPKDSYLARGDQFVARAWHNPDAVIARASFASGSATARAGDLAVTLKKGRDKDNEPVVTMEGRQNGKLAFKARDEEASATRPVAEVSLVRLEGRTPQAVFSAFTGGAHCCMDIQIATRTSTGQWTLIEAGHLDGDTGYAFEDLDGDGTREMLSGDQGFLYAFASYADSFMPARIEKLIDGKIVDVTRRPEYQRYHRQHLAWLEDVAEQDKDYWNKNGFLAAWVAQKTLVGEGADAWKRMLELYDRDSDWDMSECATDQPVDKCPEDKRLKPTFPEALRKFLDERDYR